MVYTSGRRNSESMASSQGRRSDYAKVNRRPRLRVPARRPRGALMTERQTGSTNPIMSARICYSLRLALRAVALVSGLLLAGCIAAPNILPVEKAVDAGAELGLSSTFTAVQDDWWAAYQDPQLDQLLQDALADNPTLGQSHKRIRQAQALLYATRAGVWSYVTNNTNKKHQQQKTQNTNPPQNTNAEIWK